MKPRHDAGPILYCGDPHGGIRGSFDYIVEAAERTQAAAIVLLGDMGPLRPLHEELTDILDRVWWIGGNHDSDSDDLWRRVYASGLADRCLDGKVAELPDGTRLAGLGGVFRKAVWHPDVEPRYRSRREHAKSTPRQDRWEGGPPRKHAGSIYPAELDHLATQRADVLVTHEAPGYHPHGFHILDTLAASLGVRVAVHGHHHDNLDSSAHWGAQGFKGVGVGLRGITAIDGGGVATVIVPGELDEQRGQAGGSRP